MHRKVLIAEQTETMRSVAETLLRQNGYEVITVSQASKAGEILELTKPDLIIIAADLEDSDRSRYFEKLKEDTRYNSIPRLLFEPQSKSDETFPDELVISRPFDPKEFLSKVASSLGEQTKPKALNATNPLGSASSVDDDFLDAALGIDGLDIVDSEVLDQTKVGQKRSSKQPQEKMIGLAHDDSDDDSFTDSSKIESLVIQDDASQIYHQQPKKDISIPEGSSKLEILGDQFGLNEMQKAEGADDEVHDYSWFVDSMQDDNLKKSPSPADSGKLILADPSAAVDPFTPPPASISNPTSRKKSPEAVGKAGVDKFIGEFKKEIEQLRSEDIDSLPLMERNASAPSSSNSLKWDEKIETIGHEQVDLFTKEFANSLGKEVARIIVDKIDIEKLMQIIKSELLKNRQ